MSAQLRLRDYQREAINAVFGAWSEGMRRPAIVLPTGAGKTVVFAHLISEFREMANNVPGKRVIVLVHRDELADQAINKIRAVAPELSVGKVKASDDDVTADVMVCSVQTVSRSRRVYNLIRHQDKYGKVGLIITDECHHAAAESYQRLFGHFPEALQLGVTATLERGDGVGLGSVWEDVVYSRSPLWMMKHGYLVQPRAFTEDVSGLSLKGVKTTGGDYQAGDLGRALEESDLADTLPGAWKEHAEGRPTVVFTPTVATAHQVSESFTASGVPSAVVSGETPREDRQRIFEDFRLGRCTVLVNCMVLTEGWDAPWASCAVIARPTRSRSLYQQMVGRVLRPWKGKADAIVLNVAGGGGRISTLIDLAPGEVEAAGEGEGLLEAEEREELEAAGDESQRKEITRRAKLQLKEVQGLFEASGTAWLSTAGGVMFIGAGEWTYFLWPSKAEAGGWDVLKRQSHGRWYRTPHTGLDVGMAMSWAEAEAEDHGSFSTSRKASWRKGPATEAQLMRAYRLGLDATGMSKAEASDAMYRYEVSWALDPYIGVV